MRKHEVKIPNYIHRGKVEIEMLQLLNHPRRAEFLYLRGRRRVGKSTLLKYIVTQLPHAFYFIGFNDETSDKTLERFVKKWDQFTGVKVLSKIKKSELDWPTLFDAITSSVSQIKAGPSLVLIFDEIQWIAKGLSGFIGCLKEKWLDWEQTQKIQVIICGSSNKFFFEQSGGEEKILRGLKTRADFVLPPLHLREVRKHYFSSWKVNEAFIAYMFLGGIPYYLNQLPKGEPFVSALNSAIFLSSSIFLKEVDEILNLEFNRAGVQRVKKILSAMGPLGSAQAQIKTKLKIPESTLSEAIVKLVDYGIIKEKKIYKPKNLKPHGIQYFFDDPYLIFYFAVLEKHLEEIFENEDLLLLAQIFDSAESYYIPNFTGRAFEILVRNLLLCESNESQKVLLKSLQIPDKKYEVFDSYDGSNDIDLFLEHKALRVCYAFECKWTSSQKVLEEGLAQLLTFKEKHPEIPLKLVLITNGKCGPKILRRAHTAKIKIIEIGSIIDS